MILLPSTRRRLLPDPVELLSIAERARYVEAFRLCIAAVALVAGISIAGLLLVPVSMLVAITAAYVALSFGLLELGRRRSDAAAPAAGAMVLVDGIYLMAVLAVTGGAASPLRSLLFAHVIAVVLLFSYRTGLKVAIWDTLLFLLMANAQDAGLIVAPGVLPDPATVFMSLAGLWLITFGTAMLSAVAERELRHQKVDLARLSEMVARIDACGAADEIPTILLDELCATFGFERGVVLASLEGQLALMAATEDLEDVAIADGLDPVVLRAWNGRTPELVRALDPATDPRLAALLPGARNVVVVPMLIERGERIGVIALEHRKGGPAIRRWVVAMVGQFAAHASLALHNGWLTAAREEQLETIRGLEASLRAHNAELEMKVAERTVELRDVIGHLEEVDRQRRRLLDHVVKAAEEERQRIANDLHDDPVQKLVSLKMRLELMGKANPGIAELPMINDIVRSTIRSMRHMLFDLRPPILDEQGLGPAIEYLLDNSDVPFAWSVHDDVRIDVPANTRVILYRIAQEALANARKHANAERVEVTIAERDGGVWMAVADNGVGFVPQEAVVAAPGHLGLAAIRERAEMAGGRCSLRSLPGAGTALELWLPMDETQEPRSEPANALVRIAER